MSNDHPLTLTVEQAGQALGVGRSTAYELVRTGELESIRLRRRIVVPIAHLADLLGVDCDAVWATLPDADVDPPAPPPAAPEATARARRSSSTTTETPTLF